MAGPPSICLSVRTMPLHDHIIVGDDGSSRQTPAQTCFQFEQSELISCGVRSVQSKLRIVYNRVNEFVGARESKHRRVVDPVGLHDLTPAGRVKTKWSIADGNEIGEAHRVRKN